MRRHDQPPQAFFSTCPDDRAADIVSAYIQRWSIKTTPDQVRGRLFSDALAAVRYHLWEAEHFSTSPVDNERVEIPRVSLRCLLQAVCYTH